METTQTNGFTSYQSNGHDSPALGLEASNGLQENNLLMEEVLKGEEQEALTAKMDRPDAVTESSSVEEDPKKVRQSKPSSITNTLTNCDIFIAAGTAYGAGYRVSQPQYALTNLRLVKDTAQGLVDDVAKAETKWKYAVAHRSDVFDGFEAMLSLIIAELVLGGASETTVAQARSLVRKLRGERAVPKNPNDPNASYHSVSQQNYDDIVANFAKLILMAAEDAGYDPPEDELKITGLESKLAILTAANADVITAVAVLNAARMARNAHFNTKGTGLVDLFITAKNVVLTNFGRKSEEFVKVKGLQFLRIRNVS